MNNPLETQLDHHKVGIDTIFTLDNLPAILAVMNHLLPKEKVRTYADEFQTVTNAAFYDGSLSMVNKTIEFINARKQNG